MINLHESYAAQPGFELASLWSAVKCTITWAMEPGTKCWYRSYTVEPRYLELAYFELPLISKWKSGPCFNMKLTTGNKIMWKRGEIAPKEQFLFFSTILLYIFISNFRCQITYSFVKCGCSILFSSLSQLWYVEVRISRSVSVSPLQSEITRVDYIFMKTYVVGTQQTCLGKGLLMSNNAHAFQKDPYLILFYNHGHTNSIDKYRALLGKNTSPLGPQTFFSAVLFGKTVLWS